MHAHEIQTNLVAGRRLIIVCGLPGSGKTTLARKLEAALTAVRLSADDWMTALSINLHAEAMRARMEDLQWTLAKQILEAGFIVVVEWGAWSVGARPSPARSSGSGRRRRTPLPHRATTGLV